MEVMAAVDATNNPATGPIAVVLFIAAHIINYKWGRGTKAAYVALALGIFASFLIYASTWSTWIAARFTGLLSNFDAVPAPVVMSVICVLAIVATVADIWSDPDYNNAAIWALLIGPIAAHGASGWVFGLAQVLYGGLTIVVQGLVAEALGGF